ncbi:MAG: lysostaphin resistance A-like protein [Bacteroidota bacterium]
MKLHPAWRLLVYLAACAAFTLGLGWLGIALGLSIPFLPPLAGVTLATWLAGRYLDHARLADLGLRWRPRSRTDLAVGLGLPLVLLVSILALEWAAGWSLIAGVHPAGPAHAALIWQLAMVAWYEELFARGYVLQTLNRFMDFPAANILSALVFAGLHLGNPGASPMAFGGVLLAGILLGVCFRVSRSLYLPMAFHFSWNLTQALLGYPVSGASFPGLLRLVREGPPLYTGGAFGPEAGAIGYFIIMIAMGTVWWYGETCRKEIGGTEVL